jgi:hypothetical protein
MSSLVKANEVGMGGHNFENHCSRFQLWRIGSILTNKEMIDK